MADTRKSGAAATAYSSKVDLPTPGPPRSTSVPQRPPRAASRTWSIAARSGRRSSSTNSSRRRSTTRRGPAQSLRTTGAHRLSGRFHSGGQLDEPTSSSSGYFCPRPKNGAVRGRNGGSAVKAADFEQFETQRFDLRDQAIERRLVG